MPDMQQYNSPLIGRAGGLGGGGDHVEAEEAGMDSAYKEAREENAFFISGQCPAPTGDHAVHLYCHAQFGQGTGGRNLDVRGREALMCHMRGHLQAMMPYPPARKSERFHNIAAALKGGDY